MIAADQPTIFPNDVLNVCLSDVQDGSIVFRQAGTCDRFIRSVGGTPEQTACLYVTYGDNHDFLRYREAASAIIGQDLSMVKPADGLATDRAGLGILLPLADCCGAVLYDPEHRALMVSHLGRHSVEQFGSKKSVEFLAETYGTDPGKLLVWLSPAVGKVTYPVFARGGRGLQELIVDDLIAASVPAENIQTSPIDTATSHTYFSHSEFLAGRRSVNGRHAIFAMLRK